MNANEARLPAVGDCVIFTLKLSIHKIRAKHFANRQSSQLTVRRVLGSVICLFMNYYLRFKHIPRSKKSSIYRSSVKVGEELGVSVFELAEINGVLRVVFPVYIENSIMKNLDSTPEGYSNDFSMLWNEFMDNIIPAYLVSGTEICKGSDGEPVIKDIKIIKKLSPFKIDLRINKQLKQQENESK